MNDLTVTKQVKMYFLANDISLEEAATKIGYHYKYLSKILTGDDLSNDQREKIILAYPETKPFLVPEWARMNCEETKGRQATT